MRWGGVIRHESLVRGDLATVTPAALLAAIAFGLAGCAERSGGGVDAATRVTSLATAVRRPEWKPSPEPSPAGTYTLRGAVVAVQPGGRRLTVRHEEVPGLMPAMTMPFAVRGGAASAAAGDRIEGRLRVTGRESWLEGVRVVRAAPAASAEAARRFAPREPGEPIADVRLVDQNGGSLALSELRGRTTVVTFIYTRCPLPDYCPLMSQRMAAVQREVRSDPRLRGQVSLLAVSIDPAYDTPARLREYGRRYGADFVTWRLATGTPEAVARLAGDLGVAYGPDGELINHTLETAVLDGAGRLARRFSGNEWSVAELVRAVKAATRRKG